MKHSEFILTPSGEIYHLRLKPGDLAKSIITVGDPERVRMIQKYFDQTYLERENREFATVTGRIGNTDLSVISTGIGCDNIDIVLNEIDAIFNIDFETRMVKSELTSLDIIRMGTSGSIRKEIKTGDVVISQMAFGIDNVMHFYDRENPEDLDAFTKEIEDYLGIPIYISKASTKLIQRFKSLAHHQGITFTSNGFYGPQGRQLRIPLAKKDFLKELGKIQYEHLPITNFEMETAGIYALAESMGHHALSINAILANRIEGTFFENPEQLVQQMIEQSLELIEEKEN